MARKHTIFIDALFHAAIAVLQSAQLSAAVPLSSWSSSAVLQPQPGLGSPALTRGRLGIQSPATDVSICISQPRGNNLLFGLFVCFSFSLLKIEIKD